jgi:aryl-alcohol dehydrogenase-like predicted oxidoreductase
MAQVAYAWVASRSAITAPIVGISRPGQFDDAVKALEINLTVEDVAELERDYLPKPIAGHM